MKFHFLIIPHLTKYLVTPILNLSKKAILRNILAIYRMFSLHITQYNKFCFTLTPTYIILLYDKLMENQ